MAGCPRWQEGCLQETVCLQVVYYHGGMLSPGDRLSPGGRVSPGGKVSWLIVRVAYCQGGMLSPGGRLSPGGILFWWQVVLGHIV